MILLRSCSVSKCGNTLGVSPTEKVGCLGCLTIRLILSLKEKMGRKARSILASRLFTKAKTSSLLRYQELPRTSYLRKTRVSLRLKSESLSFCRSTDNPAKLTFPPRRKSIGLCKKGCRSSTICKVKFTDRSTRWTTKRSKIWTRCRTSTCCRRKKILNG